MTREFRTTSDFRRSLEGRLQQIAAKEGKDLERLRRKVAFDRLLARICDEGSTSFVLKGGYAMELRMATARATKDIDLTCQLSSLSLDKEGILEEVRSRGRRPLEDYFSYEIGAARLDLDGPPYGGERYPVTSFIDGRPFVRFQLDIGLDILTDEVEMVQATDWLSYCGIDAPMVPMVSVEQQLAEKIHAYTLPRPQRDNTRVKDLIDFLLITNYRNVCFERMSHSLAKVFRVRDTHALPSELAPPPDGWERVFSSLASECGIGNGMEQAYERLCAFYRAALNGVGGCDVQSDNP